MEDASEYRTECPQHRIDRTALATIGTTAVERRRDARKAIDRNSHALVVHATRAGVQVAEVPDAHADWWYDLRRGSLRIYGGLLRFIDVSYLKRGVSKATLKLIPGWLSAYIDDL